MATFDILHPNSLKSLHCHKVYTTLTQDVNWMCIRFSEDVLDVFWMAYVRPSYALYPELTEQKICEN